MQVIGLRGHIGAGKTTLAQALVNKYPHYCVKLSMAGPLKEGLALMGITKEATPDIYREAAQQLGTNIVRKHDENFWVNRFKERLIQFHNHLLSPPKFAIVDDIRFKNEAECCDKIFYVARNGEYKLFVDMNQRECLDVHESEVWSYEGPGPTELVICNNDDQINEAVKQLTSELGLE